MNTIAVDSKHLKHAEWMLRLVMIFTLATAGVSKLLSDGSFYNYYSALFANQDLRIQLPNILVDLHLLLTPFIEIGIALALIFTRIRRYAITAWWIWFIMIQFGHYVLQDWSAVNEIIPYQILGVLCYVLPAHNFLQRQIK